MSPSRSAAIALNELRVLRRDPMPLIVLLLMPLINASLLSRAFRAALVLSGHPRASGADFTIPAQIAMFGFFLVPYTGFLFFREYQWKTSARLRASPASTVDIIVGKTVPMIALGILQVAVLLLIGDLAMGLHLHGEAPAVVAISVVYICCAVAIGVALTAGLRTMQQLNAVGFLGATLLGAIGGALVPLSALPSWTRNISGITPQYWVMRASHDVILDHKASLSILLPIVVLCALSAVSIAVSVRLLRLDDEKAA
jgi:ABC-2 type transport system permease protein